MTSHDVRSLPSPEATNQAVAALRTVRAELELTVTTLLESHDARALADIRRTEGLAERCLADGNHTALSVGIVDLLNSYHERRHEYDGRLQGLLERIEAAVHPLLPSPDVEHTQQTDVMTRAHKRLRSSSLTGDPFVAVGGRGLNAGQWKLWDTVLPQSALLPDVAALYDVYHPAVALYTTAQDRPVPTQDPRHWLAAGIGVQLGCFASTILVAWGTIIFFIVPRSEEFCHVGVRSRRFTFVHILHTGPCCIRARACSSSHGI